MKKFNNKRSVQDGNIGITNAGFIRQIETIMKKKKQTLHLVYRN